MDPESVRTITTFAYFGYRTQKHTHKTDDLEKEVERRKNELITAYRQVSGYYQLEGKYSEQISLT
jgi:hypothetical protein